MDTGETEVKLEESDVALGQVNHIQSNGQEQCKSNLLRNVPRKNGQGNQNWGLGREGSKARV